MIAKTFERCCALRNGAHVVMVINAKNTKASMTTAMIAATCRLLNLPVICATIGHTSRLLTSSLGAKNVVEINYPSSIFQKQSGESHTAGDDYKASDHHVIQNLLDDAREKGAVLLLDVYIGENFDGKDFLSYIDLKRKETISIVLPIWRKRDVEVGARTISRIGPDRCMVHLYDFGYNGVKKCGMGNYILKSYPIWQSEGPTDAMLHVMQRKDNLVYLPPFPDLPKYYKDFVDYVQTDHKPAICDTLNHLYSLAEVTYKHVFRGFCGEFF